MAEPVLFRPSKKMLEAIAFDIASPADIKKTEQYFITTPLTIPSTSIMGLYHLMAEFYRPLYKWNVGEDESHLEAHAFADLINDAIMNGLCHGNKGMVMTGVFLGKSGACYGFRDFGDYFTRQDVKARWEAKDIKGIKTLGGKRIRKERGHASSGAGLGVDYIVESSDRIEVDNNLGVLYALQGVDRFLRLSTK